METSSTYEVAATSNQAAIVFTNTKNPYDSRFNPSTDKEVVIDQDGNLYRQTEVQYFLGKSGTRLVNLASLKLDSAFDLMRTALNSRDLSDCKKLFKELGKIISPEDAPVDIENLKVELSAEKMKPEIEETPAKFRLFDNHIKALQKYHVQTGKSASTINEELGKLPNGKDVLPVTTILKWIKKVKKEN